MDSTIHFGLRTALPSASSDYTQTGYLGPLWDSSAISNLAVRSAQLSVSAAAGRSTKLAAGHIYLHTDNAGGMLHAWPSSTDVQRHKLTRTICSSRHVILPCRQHTAPSHKSHSRHTELLADATLFISAFQTQNFTSGLHICCVYVPPSVIVLQFFTLGLVPCLLM